MNKPLTRAEVAPETTWDLADLFATRGAWLAELAAVERSVESVVQHEGRLAAGPAVLLACLGARDELLARLDPSGFDITARPQPRLKRPAPSSAALPARPARRSEILFVFCDHCITGCRTRPGNVQAHPRLAPAR